MIEQEIRRLEQRQEQLQGRVIPELERRTEFLYTQILTLAEGSTDREKMEQEYGVLSKELRLRSDEMFANRQQIDRFQNQLKARKSLIR